MSHQDQASTSHRSPATAAAAGEPDAPPAHRLQLGDLSIGLGMGLLIGALALAAVNGMTLGLWLMAGAGTMALVCGLRWARKRPPVVTPAEETVPSATSRHRKAAEEANTPALPAVPRPAPLQNSGLKIVAIGGGTGMPQLLRGLRAYTEQITAIVTVADDGGSSGRLRRDLGTLPPGDFRNNIAALSDAEELLMRLFQYRFADADVTGSGSRELAGHSFGNLFIATMGAVTGSFEAGLDASSRILAVRGRVVPSTLDHVILCAEVCHVGPDGVEEWTEVAGESNITASGGRIVRAFLRPDNVRSYPEATRAILQADLIVAGPGSFFTSVMPNLLVPGIRDAIRAAPAPRIFICNVATQPGETDGFDVSDHMRQLRQHAGDAFTTVLANNRYHPARPLSASSTWVELPAADDVVDYTLLTDDLVDEQQPWRHDSAKLAAALMKAYATLAQKAADN